MLGILLTILHVVVAIFLILVVLLQTGKRADLAGAFGGGGSQTAFGTRGAATLLSKLTTASAVAFMLTSLGLSLLSSQRMGGTVLPPDDPGASAPVTMPGPEVQVPPVPETGLPPEPNPDAPPPVEQP
jgi:preprotein translocase subunit SecG